MTAVHYESFATTLVSTPANITQCTVLATKYGSVLDFLFTLASYILGSQSMSCFSTLRLFHFFIVILSRYFGATWSYTHAYKPTNLKRAAVVGLFLDQVQCGRVHQSTVWWSVSSTALWYIEASGVGVTLDQTHMSGLMFTRIKMNIFWCISRLEISWWVIFNSLGQKPIGLETSQWFYHVE